MSVLRAARLCTLLVLGSISLALTGCAFSVGPIAGSGSTTTGGVTPGSPTAKGVLGGRVYGAQSPITGATVTLWAAGTTGSYGTGQTLVATNTTDSNGNFSFNTAPGVSPCTTGQLLYITSTGGNTGSGNNQYAALMAALPSPCSAATGNTYVVVNEVTTVASVTALQQFMSIAPGGSPAWMIGAPAANATGLANAFTQVGNLVNIGTGTSGATSATNTVNSVTYTTTITPDSTKINTMADVLAACINTTGNSVCTSLFTNTTPLNFAAPTDTIQVAYYLATNPGGLNLPNSPGEPAYLASNTIPGTAIPFNPYNASLTDWTIDVNWTTSNGTATVGTATAASVAIDGSGNIWTASLNTVATGQGVTEFNPAGQVQFAPFTTAPVAGGWHFSTCTTCGTAANLGGTKQGDALAIDTNGNAWASSYNGSSYTIVTSQPEGVIAEITPPIGANPATANAYLVGSFPAGLAIDGSNNLYVGDDSSTSTNRWYEAELVAAGTPSYSTFETGTGRTAGNGDYYIGAAVDETAAQYVWPVSTACQTTIPRITNSPSLGTASTVGSTTVLPAAACYIAADASGNAWVSAAPGTGAAATALEYVNVNGNLAANIASPIVTQYAQGSNGVATGSQLGGGLYNPQGMAIDGTGNLWVVNSNGSTGGGISEFAPSNNGTVLTPVSPSGTSVWGFFSNTTIATPIGAAIDNSGNVWFKTKGGSYLYYLVGAASPVVTPLAAAVKTGFIAERPGATLLASVTSALNYSTVLSTGEPQTATLTNTGTATMKINSVSISGTNQSDFAVTGNTCGATLAVGANCTITVTFTSSTPGTFTAALNVNSNAVVSPAAATLTGTADTSVGLGLVAGTSTPPSVPSITFPTIVAGSVTTGQAVVVTNNGSVPLTISSLAMSGAGANLFNEATTCGSTVAVGASCEISFVFGPKVAGTYAATLTLNDNAGTGSQTVSLSGVATPFTIAVNTTTANAWVIDNGAITFNWNSSSGNLVSWVLDGYTDQLVDTTTTSNGQPYGLYMDNTGSLDNASVPTTGGVAATPVASCTIVGGTVTGPTTCTTGTGRMPYFDWSLTLPDSANSGNEYTFVEHWVVFPNDPGVHTYVELVHSTSDTAASVGQIQWVFRDSQSIFTNTYEVNSGLGILGVEDIPRPPVADTSSTDPGRTVQNAAEDLHGFNNLPVGFTREFDTKYDYAGYEYLHQAHGTYGPAPSGTTYGAWTVLPSLETLVGGPTKQDLWFTGNIDMIEAYSDHEDLPINMNTAAGVAYNRLFGPYYIHVNVLGQAYNQTGNILATQADLYADAISAETAIVPQYDNESQLVAAGYVPSTGRGTVSIQMNGVTGGGAHTAWAVLSDPTTNFQVSFNGLQYWADISSTGSATFTGVAPGTYRLSVYVLGQWGEYRQDGIVVTANSITTVPPATWAAENFAGTTGETVFTIGTPDRSSHEFLHGHNTTTGKDDREYWGNWNYWQDFAANSGAVVYYATAVGGTPATNNLQLWNYDHWGSSFNPGLYAGVFNSSDDTTDGYQAYPGQEYPGVGGVGAEYAIPAYVASLPTASGTNGAGTAIPAWQVYFATPSDIANYGSGYVELSISAACAYGSYVVTLNPSGANVQRIWHYTNYSDCVIRSGLSGYTQWFVMEFPASALNQTPLGSNEITVSMSQEYGAEDDAWRLELTNTSSNPTVTGWNDYTYVYGTGSTQFTLNNDAIPNP
jgi:hypothetical protein